MVWRCFGSQFHSSSLCHESVLSNLLQSFNILTSGGGASPTAAQDTLGKKKLKKIKINLKPEIALTHAVEEYNLFDRKLVVRGLLGVSEGRGSAWNSCLKRHRGKEIPIYLVKLLAAHTDLSQFVILMMAMRCGIFRFYISALRCWQLTAHWF